MNDALARILGWVVGRKVCSHWCTTQNSARAPSVDTTYTPSKCINGLTGEHGLATHAAREEVRVEILLVAC